MQSANSPPVLSYRFRIGTLQIGKRGAWQSGRWDSVTLEGPFSPVVPRLSYQMLKPLCPSTVFHVSQKNGVLRDQLGMAAAEETLCIAYATKIKPTFFQPCFFHLPPSYTSRMPPSNAQGSVTKTRRVASNLPSLGLAPGET